MSQQKQLIMDNKEFVWDEKTIKDYGEFTYFTWKSKGYYNREESFREFLQSKQPKRDWQIESFKLNGNIYTHEGGKSSWYWRQPKGSAQNETTLLSTATIESVRRLSDGEIFKIGDKINYKGEEGYPFWDDGDEFCKIDKFSLHNGYIFVNSHYKGRPKKTISEWYKAPEKPKPLLTTNEGYECFDPEEFLYYVASFKVREKKAKNMLHLDNAKFKRKDAAEEFILMNKPLISLNEIINVCWGNAMTTNEAKYLRFDSIKQLAKSKIDKQQ